MRTRSIIRLMEAGDPGAFDKAEAKLDQPDVRDENKAELRAALERLQDPRKRALNLGTLESAGYIVDGRVVETWHR